MPDVIVEDRPKLPQIAADGVESDLQPYIDRDGFDSSGFWDFTWNQTLYNGDSYGIPFETDVRVLFYDKNAFQEAGLDPNKPPTTWDEVWQYADKLDKKNADGSYSRMAFFPLFGNAGVEVWGYTNSVDWVTQDQNVNINSPAAVETVQWIKKWVDRYGGWQNIQNFKAEYSAMPNDLFMGGGVAMIVDVAGYNSQLNFYRPKYTQADGTQVNMDWGVGLMPYNTQPASWSGGFALSIPTGAKNPDAAWEFIKCATGEQAQVSWSRDTYAIPTLKDAANNPELMADPFWQFFIQAMETSTGGTYLVKYPNWGQELTPRLEQVWLGELQPQQAMDEAQAAVEAQLK